MELELVQHKSAGGIILYLGDHKLIYRNVILVNQIKDDSWSFPKGHIDDEEDVLEAAEREIFEETGIHGDNLKLEKRFEDYFRFHGNTKELKQITLFHFTTEQYHLIPQDMFNPKALWTPLEETAKKLTNPVDQNFFLQHQNYLETFIYS
tara:strand:+ start:291 stop:740 length:450 start_codon:yes stop_codon:yes gene_type:complete